MTAPAAKPVAAGSTNFLTGNFAAPAAGSVASALTPVAAAIPAPPPRTRAPGPTTWEGFIQWVRGERPLLASILENGAPEGQLPDPAIPQADTLLLCFSLSDGYYRDQLQARVYADELGALAKAYFGRTVVFRYELKEIGESVALRRDRERTAWESTARQAAQSHPIIAEARALFGGDLSPIELIEPSGDGGGGA